MRHAYLHICTVAHPSDQALRAGMGQDGTDAVQAPSNRQTKTRPTRASQVERRQARPQPAPAYQSASSARSPRRTRSVSRSAPARSRGPAFPSRRPRCPDAVAETPWATGQQLQRAARPERAHPQHSALQIRACVCCALDQVQRRKQIAHELKDLLASVGPIDRPGISVNQHDAQRVSALAAHGWSWKGLFQA